MNKVFAFLLLTLATFSVEAQITDPVSWEYSAEHVEDNTYLLTFKANIEKGWYLYSQHLDDGGPIPTSFSFEESKDYKLLNEVEENGAFVEGFDEMFEMQIRKYKEFAEFKVKVESDKEAFKVEGVVEFMTCDDHKCLPPTDVEFVFDFTE